jgi:hypothetical protein
MRAGQIFFVLQTRRRARSTSHVMRSPSRPALAGATKPSLANPWGGELKARRHSHRGFDVLVRSARGL